MLLIGRLVHFLLLADIVLHFFIVKVLQVEHLLVTTEVLMLWWGHKVLVG